MSVLILTLNEEVNLPNCLASLTWCDDVVVLDSYSTDGTEAIAKNWGVRFVQREFDDYASQRNYGLTRIKYGNAWVFMVDADEVVPPELAQEIQTTVNTCSDAMCLYRIRRKDYFVGRWIRYSSGYPTWFGRLARLGRVRVERAINEEYHTDGQVGLLKEHFVHYPFNKGFHVWVGKHNRYSTMEAEAMMSGSTHRIRLKELYHSDPVIRRKAIKGFVYSLPGRPLLMFCGMYFLRRGFLDGRAGLTYCLFRAFYEFMINCKVKEIQLRKKGMSL